MELPDKIAFVDTETTGGNSQADRIIEIGIVRVERGQVVASWSSLVDPDQHIPPEIIHITGIRPKDLASAPTFRTIADQVEELLSDCIFAAHNARFDYSFVKSELSRLGRPLTARQLCTVKLSRYLYPEYIHHSLDELIARFSFPITHRHRALDDASISYQFYHQALKERGEPDFLKAISDIMLHPGRPGKIAPAQLDSLPECAGVYIFYGQTGMPLYVGKSLNIKNRVLSHLSSSLQSAKELQLSQEVSSIEVETTSGELGALLLESELVKKLRPLYNRQLRPSNDLFLVQAHQIGPYKSAFIARGDYPTPETLGLFKTSKHAQDFLHQKTKSHNLCPKLLGVEKIRSTCFNADLGVCQACTGGEDPLAYNLRFDLAFATDKLPVWPFPGPIAVNEDGQVHVFDNWCYLGKSQELEPDLKNPKFDLDTYKILKRFLKNPKNYSSISGLIRETDHCQF